MIRYVRSLSWRPAGIALLVAGLGGGGLWLAQGHASVAVQAQESQPPASGQTPGVAPVKVSAKPTGVVMAIADDRASFIFRSKAGEERTVRVNERTVITGRGDRPYNMGLLQAGDHVRLKIVGMKDKSPDATKAEKRGEGTAVGRKPKPTVADGTSVARRVIVRPAAEGPFPEGGKLEKGARKSGQPGAGSKKGGLDSGASQ